MSGSDPILQEVEDSIVDLLNPIMGEVSDNPDNLIRGIETQYFSNGEQVVSLIQRTIALMPGAFLSIPDIDYASPPIPAVSYEPLTYKLLVGIVDRRDIDAGPNPRKTYYYKLAEALRRNLFFKVIVLPSGIQMCTPDRIRPVRLEYATVGTIAAAMLTFTLSLRNVRN